MKKKIEPYEEKPYYYSPTKWEIYHRIILSFKVFDIPEDLQQLILEALHDDYHWDWYRECNGANIVSEPGWKGKYSPPYIRHDYDWKIKPTLKSNWTMHRIQLAYGMDRWRSWLRWFGVTFFGYPVHRLVYWWKYVFIKI